MAKKATRTRRDGRPRLNESQLQAYRARKAETVIVARPTQPAAAGEVPAPTGPVSKWGHVHEEYAMIRADLIRLLIITGLMFLIIIGLWLYLR